VRKWQIVQKSTRQDTQVLLMADDGNHNFWKDCVGYGQLLRGYPYPRLSYILAELYRYWSEDGMGRRAFSLPLLKFIGSGKGRSITEKAKEQSVLFLGVEAGVEDALEMRRKMPHENRCILDPSF